MQQKRRRSYLSVEKGRGSGSGSSSGGGGGGGGGGGAAMVVSATKPAAECIFAVSEFDTHKAQVVASI